MNENTTTRPLDEIEDDGSLACLGLDTDRERKVFSCPAASNACGSYQGWMKYGDTRNLIHKLNTIANGKVFK